MPLDLVLSQLPKRLVVGERCFELEYRTVDLECESFEKLVVIVSDISAELANEQARGRQRDILEGFGLHLLSGGFSRLSEQRAPRCQRARRRYVVQERDLALVDTLKGNCAVMGLSVLAEQCHILEDELVEASQLRRASIEALAQELALVEERLGPLLRTRSTGEVSLRAGEYQAFLRDVMAAQPHSQLLAQVRSWDWSVSSAILAV